MNTLELSKLVDLKKTSHEKKLGNQPNKIIGLSGASGFLGLHLLNELVKRKDVQGIKCFIRDREKFNLKKKEFNLFFNEEKLQFVEHYDKNDFKDLTNFIHSAAQLHNLKKYTGLWKDNVELTKNFLEYSQDIKFHYISTLSVFASSNICGKHYPVEVKPCVEHILYGGYAQTKWLGEYLTQTNSQHQIFRLGLLTPSRGFPHIQKEQFLYLFLKLIKQLKIYPECYENAWVDLSPVDLVAKKIVDSLDSQEKIFHIANEKSTSLSHLLSFIDSKPVDIKIWIEKTHHLKSIEKMLLEFAFFKTKALQQYPQYFNIDLFQSTGHDWQGNLKDNSIFKVYLENLDEKI